MRKKIYLMNMMSSRHLPMATDANNIMETEDFREYVGTHGYHFTESLADYVMEHMKQHAAQKGWNTKEVLTAMKAYDIMQTPPDGHTWGDIAYYVNQGRADIYPELLRSDQDCLKYGRMMAEDPDGYPEMAFMHYVSNLIGTGKTVDWDRFM